MLWICVGQCPPDEFITHAATIHGRLLFCVRVLRAAAIQEAATLRCVTITQVNRVCQLITTLLYTPCVHAHWDTIRK